MDLKLDTDGRDSEVSSISIVLPPLLPTELAGGRGGGFRKAEGRFGDAPRLTFGFVRGGSNGGGNERAGDDRFDWDKGPGEGVLGLEALYGKISLFRTFKHT